MLGDGLGALGLHHQTEDGPGMGSQSLKMSQCISHGEKQFPYLSGDNSIFRNNSRSTDLPWMSHPPHVFGVFFFWNIGNYNPLPDLLLNPSDPPTLGLLPYITQWPNMQNIFQKPCINISSKCTSLQFLCQVMLHLAMSLLQKTEHHTHLLRKGMRLFLIRLCPEKQRYCQYSTLCWSHPHLLLPACKKYKITQSFLCSWYLSNCGNV